MNQKTLTQEQIDHLFDFVRKKYVRYIDVQYELVDHLATGIEEQWETNPELPFKQALNNVYSNFPVTGFTNYVTAAEKELGRYWRGRVYRYILAYFKLPKVILTLGLLLLFWNIFFIANKWLIAASILVVFGASFYSTIRISMVVKHHVGKDYGKYLFARSFYDYTGGMGFGFSILFNHLLPKDGLDVGVYVALGLALLFSITTIWTHATLTAFPQMLIDDIHQKYKYLNLHSA